MHTTIHPVPACADSSTVRHGVILRAPLAVRSTIVRMTAEALLVLNRDGIVETHQTGPGWACLVVLFGSPAEVEPLTTEAHLAAQHVTACDMEIVPA